MLVLGKLTRLSRDYAQVLEQVNSLLLIAEDRMRTGINNPAISGWSVSQHIEHLSRAGSVILDRIEESLSQQPGKGNCSGPSFMGRIVLLTGHIPRRKAKAPDLTIPVGVEPDVLINDLRSMQNRIKVLASRLSDMVECRCSTPHPMLGNFTPAQWIRFLVIHQQHHILIIDEIAGISNR